MDKDDIDCAAVAREDFSAEKKVFSSGKADLWEKEMRKWMGDWEGYSPVDGNGPGAVKGERDD